MGVLDEQVPGQGSNPSNPSAFLAQLAQMFQSNAGKGGAPQQPGVVSPAHIGQVTQPQAPPTYGMGGPQLPGVQPSIIPGATSGGPFAGYKAPQPITDTAFQNKAARTSAITQNLISGVASGYVAYKQTQFKKKVQEAKAAAMVQLQQQNPQFQQAVQTASKANPEAQKAFEKSQEKWMKIYEKAMSDPNSPEYYGIQQAYQEAMTQAQLRDQAQEQKEKIAQAVATRQAEQARAEAERARASSYGTPEQEHKYKMEEIQAQNEGRLAKANADNATRLKQTIQRGQDMLRVQQERNKAAFAKIDVDKMKAGQKTKQDASVMAVFRQSKALEDQINGVIKAAKPYQDWLDKHSIQDSFDSDQAVAARNQIALYDAQLNDLRQKQDSVNMAIDALTGAGKLQPAAPEPSSAPPKGAKVYDMSQ